MYDSICADCERELFDPDNRRYLYPFIHCPNCGPQFTTIQGTLYDRPNLARADFAMCNECASEYTNPFDRRFQARLLTCPNCGPFVELRETRPRSHRSDLLISSIEFRLSAILKARRLLREGQILALKGLAGFRLACNASNSFAVEELRRRAGGAGKPFVLLAANMKIIEFICQVNKEERDGLSSSEKPLPLEGKSQATPHVLRVSAQVAPLVNTLSMMLPDTPLYHLLLNQTDLTLDGEPVPPVLVMTSGDFGEAPMVTSNEEALRILSSRADAFLLHNADMHIFSGG